MSIAIHADDLAAWVAAIETRFEDYANLVPEVSTLAAQVASVGPRILTEVNLAASTTFGDGTLSGLLARLPDSVLTIAEAGVIAEVLYDAYRQLTMDEKEWADVWRERFDAYLARLSSGTLSLVDTSADDSRGSVAVAGAARVFGKAPIGGTASTWLTGDSNNRVDVGGLF